MLRAVPSIGSITSVEGEVPSDLIPLSRATSASAEAIRTVGSASPSLPAELPAEGSPAYKLLHLLKEFGIASKFDGSYYYLHLACTVFSD